MKLLLLFVFYMMMKENGQRVEFAPQEMDRYDDFEEDLGRRVGTCPGGRSVRKPDRIPYHYIYVYEKEDPSIPVKNAILRIKNVSER